MQLLELIFIAISLSMDAFAVSICKGLSVTKVKLKHMLACGLYFGGFQGLMPLLGFYLGKMFEQLVVSIDHWIAFALLAFIGINMIKDSRKVDEEMNSSFSFFAMLPLAIATSIDALSVGITFAFLKVDIFQAVCLIFITTFIFSVVGVNIGKTVGCKYKSKAEAIGGIILIILGTKILLEHLGIV